MICINDELSSEEKQALDEVEIERILAKVFEMCPPDPPRPWVVVHAQTKCVIKRYESQAKARASCAVRNAKAYRLGLNAVYVSCHESEIDNA